LKTYFVFFHQELYRGVKTGLLYIFHILYLILCRPIWFSHFVLCNFYLARLMELTDVRRIIYAINFVNNNKRGYTCADMHSCTLTDEFI